MLVYSLMAVQNWMDGGVHVQRVQRAEAGERRLKRGRPCWALVPTNARRGRTEEEESSEEERYEGSG